MTSPGLRFRWIVLVLSVGDEGTSGGVRTAEAARCSNGGKGVDGLCQWFRWGASR